MNKIELRAKYGSDLELYREHRTPFDIWKTHHSLQLTRLGFHLLKKYTKDKNIPLLTIEIQNGRIVSELLMIANTMDVPYFLTEKHVNNKVVIHTIESDRSTMLIMNNGNIPHWANMFRDS